MIPLALLDGMFLNTWQTNRVFFVSWILTVIISVVLHELGHGFAAIRQGDDTPIVTGHMTLNPLVHMGMFSLVALLVAGIAWGMMPVNPARFRSKHGDAIVSFAGPAVNLLLALVGLTTLGLLIRTGALPDTNMGQNVFTFLRVFGMANIVLFLLNLLPLPPLDGSRVVASFVPAYRRLAANPNNQGVFFVILIAILISGPSLFGVAGKATAYWVQLIAG